MKRNASTAYHARSEGPSLNIKGSCPSSSHSFSFISIPYSQDYVCKILRKFLIRSQPSFTLTTLFHDKVVKSLDTNMKVFAALSLLQIAAILSYAMPVDEINAVADADIVPRGMLCLSQLSKSSRCCVVISQSHRDHSSSWTRGL